MAPGGPLGGLLTGQITPVWSSEIEPFAIRVTTKRLPQVKHYGDVSAISGADLPPVDIITFGSPCQDMSIAGSRFRRTLYAIHYANKSRRISGGMSLTMATYDGEIPKEGHFLRIPYIIGYNRQKIAPIQILRAILVR